MSSSLTDTTIRGWWLVPIGRHDVATVKHSAASFRLGFANQQWCNSRRGNGRLQCKYSYLPFGAGMRACAGMDVGKLQLAFSVCNLVYAFHWSNAVVREKPDLTEDLTFVLAMKTLLQARIVPRGI
ncbi:hypothetical protein MRB53_015133 [Persea americana]|uniref:Uncharacterized protein n=1 Tax=Persea americana TaxID=3435 RepID=A0ACC2KD91_PERAE|nr:hypothetical protein MRB53_015133 [Persea americana]